MQRHWRFRSALTRRGAIAGGLGVAGWAFAGPTRAQTIDGPSALAQIYRRLPAISAVALSPDGHKLAIAANEADASGVRIFDLETRQIIARFTTGKNQSLRGVAWADDSFALATVSATIRASQAERDGWVFRGGQRLLEYYR